MDIQKKLRKELESLEGVKVYTITLYSTEWSQLIDVYIVFNGVGKMYSGHTIGDIIRQVERDIENAR